MKTTWSKKMKKHLLTRMNVLKVCTLVFLVFGLSIIVHSDSGNIYIEQGEQYRKNNQTSAERDAFLQAHKLEPNNAEILWKLARVYVDLANVEKDKNKKKDLYKQAEIYAKKGIQCAPKNSMCYTYDGIAVGKVALGEGSKEKVRLSAKVKESVEKAIELNPKNDTAYHLLGRWHRNVANLSGVSKAFAKILYGGLPSASNQSATENLEKAIELAPKFINHHLELAITYQTMKKWNLALKSLDTVDQLPATAKLDNEYKQKALTIRKIIIKKVK